MKSIEIREIEEPEEKSRVCERVLRALPKWFGIEAALLDYVADVKSMQVWAARAPDVIGFIAIHRHNQFTAEIHVMGLLPEYHGRKIGDALVRTAEENLRAIGFKFLTVKTLSESRPNPEYDRTRRFYLRTGFYPLEEFKTLWGEANPCLFLVKPL